MPSGLSVVHAIDGLRPAAGGPSRTVVELADALAAEPGLRVTLVSQRLAGEPSILPGGGVALRIVEAPSDISMKLGWAFRAELEHIARDGRPALIHNHGLWNPSNHWAAATARRHGIPLVTHPRGMLEPWALRHKAWKKRIALGLYQRRDLEQARALVATSQVECDNLRALGFRQPVAVIPNGVRLAGHDVIRGGRPPNRVHTVLFLSRVHPVKGLLNLVQAWAQSSIPGWKLVIAGPDEGGHLADVLSLVERLGLGGSVQYVGAVDGEAKSDLYRQADVFVLPTFTENFGVVVAEALAQGLPVITTRGAPWSDLPRHGCGWWVDAGAEPLAGALREAMALSDEQRREMGERGRSYVVRYDWRTIAQRTASLYLWVVGNGDRPDCVQVA